MIFELESCGLHTESHRLGLDKKVNVNGGNVANGKLSGARVITRPVECFVMTLCYSDAPKHKIQNQCIEDNRCHTHDRANPSTRQKHNPGHCKG